jgi:secondary thiamine-phosphate synthase enzyme
MIVTESIRLHATGGCDIHDITPMVRELVAGAGVGSGTVTVFVPGSTGGLTTIEHEPGLMFDLPELMEKLVPSNKTYRHDQTWHDGNGFSHLRAALIGPDITVPFVNHELTLGTWQQIVFIDFDNRARNRELVVQIMGE